MSQKPPCHTRKAFTLIEVLVVMLIIAILATIGVSAFTSSQKKGRDAKRKTDLAQLQRGLEAYINDYGTYPTSDAQGRIVGCGTGDTQCPWGEAFSNATNDTVYVAQLPKDTTSGQQYYYEFVEPNGYRIYSRLENTQDTAIPETGQYSTICGEGTTKYCNYVVTSENVASPVAYSIPTCTADAQSCTDAGECCGGYCCDGKCQSTACLKPDGASCSLASECSGGYCCEGICQSSACVCTTYYADQDGDGYGAGSPVQKCGSVSGYVTNNTDCYDQNANAHPGSTYCSTTNRGDGSFDYDCNGSQTACGTMYYAFSSCACATYPQTPSTIGLCSASLCRGSYVCTAYNTTPASCGQNGTGATQTTSAINSSSFCYGGSGPGGDPCRQPRCCAIACTGYISNGTTGTQGCN